MLSHPEGCEDGSSPDARLRRSPGQVGSRGNDRIPLCFHRRRPFVSFTPAVDIYGRIFLWMFAALLIAFSCLIAIASSRRRTFELDDERIRCTGRPRANFDVAWKDVTRIEILRYRRGAPLAYVLRGPNGAILATFSPGELGAAAGESLALAVEKNAHNVGLPIVRPY